MSPQLVFWLRLFLLEILCLHGASAQPSPQTPTVSPFTPGAIPLAVRHPYLSTWLTNGSAPLATNWPTFWTSTRITGWAGFVRIDGTAYRFMGNPPEGTPMTQTAANFTATRSTFTFEAGPCTVVVEFLSPIEPTDFVKQSMPFSYLAVFVTPNDNQQHSIQVYSDISAEWLNSQDSAPVTWSSTNAQNILYHQIQLKNPTAFSETADMSNDYMLYYATLAGSGTTYQTGQDTVVRSQFASSGTLSNTQDTQFRSINGGGSDFPVFGFATSYMAGGGPVVFAVGMVPDTDGVVEYANGADGSLEERYLYYLGSMNTTSALSSFLSDYSPASSRATTLDNKIASDAGAFSIAYADLCALAARQVFGAIQITISMKTDGSGGYNTSDVMTFLKEISSSGNIQTMDVIYPSMPLFLYTNPDILTTLLEPVLQYMESGQYSAKFVPHDLGNYPIAGGVNAKTENQPVEESANMLIMAYAAARLGGSGNQLRDHYDTLKGAADYLVANALIPGTQSSTDDFLGVQANTTNLALKGIIGIKTMSAIRAALNMSDTNPSYGSTALGYITQWTNLALSADGTTMLSTYNNKSSFAMAYNLYADALLGTELVPQSVYKLTGTYVQGFKKSFGVPLDSRQPTNSKTDWSLFTAAALSSSDPTSRDTLIGLVHAYAAAGTTNTAFDDFYDVVDGTSVSGFRARPVQGAIFSLLALKQPAQNITVTAASPSPTAASGTPGASPTAKTGTGNALTAQLIPGFFILVLYVSSALVF